MYLSILTALALFPAIMLVILVYYEDKVEKEPIKLLLLIFFCGALTCIPAGIIETIADNIVQAITGADMDHASIPQLFFQAFFIVGITEEFVKYSVIMLVAWKNKEFNYTFDAMVYSVTASLGFAALENVGYVWSYGFGTAVTRAIISVPGHAMFGVYMGMYVGFAKYCESQGYKPGVRANLIKAVVIPAAIHGFFDFCLFTQSVIMIVVFFIFEITMLVIAVKKIKLLSKGDTAVFQNYYAWLWRRNRQNMYYNQMNRPQTGGYNAQMQNQYGQQYNLQYEQNTNWQANQNPSYSQAQNMNWQPTPNAYQQQVMANQNLSAQPSNVYDPSKQPQWQPAQNMNYQPQQPVQPQMDQQNQNNMNN
jgi:RsiW-degrading membrane proteinase PrsW (M82 family)